MIQYKSVPGPVGITINRKEDYATAIKQYASIIDSESVGGWKFEFIRKIPVTKKAGCLASLFGQENTTLYMNMLVFSKDDAGDITLNAQTNGEINGPISQMDSEETNIGTVETGNSAQNTDSSFEVSIPRGLAAETTSNAYGGTASSSVDKKRIVIFAGGAIVAALIIGILISSCNRSKPAPYDYDYAYSDYESDFEPDYTDGDEPIDYLAGVNVEQEVTKIREIYNNIMSSISDGDYSHKSVSYGSKTATAYFDGNELRCVMTDPDENGCFQWYYYEDGELIFSYIESDYSSDRLYFSDGRMIRRRHCDDKNNSDAGYNDDLIYDEEYIYYEDNTTNTSKQWLDVCGVSTNAPRVSRYDVSDVTASSWLEEPEYDISHYPQFVTENRTETAWVEGAPGNGIGEYITLHLNDKYTISGFEIMAGYWKSDSLYEKNSRPKELLVSFPDGTEYEVSLDDVQKCQSFTFDSPVEASEVTFTIEKVYSGSKYEDTAISYIELF